MESLRYTASARLGVWDSIPRERDKFLASLARLLQDNSHGVLEADQIEFIPTDNPLLASVTAICDKIIARGNPTVVDLDFERALLKGPCRRSLHVEERTEDDPAVGFWLSAFKMTDQLLKAAEDLLCLPFGSQTGLGAVTPSTLHPELQRLVSEEEDLFLDQFTAAFGDHFGIRLHRQVLIRDLVDHQDDELAQSRVDFVLQAGPLRWVFEVDGSQHNEPGQRALDEKRDVLLKEHGWTVYRISAAEVRQGLAIEKWKTILSPEEASRISDTRYNSVQIAIAKSEIHAAAYHSILVPLAMQRCLRGLLLLYSHEILAPARRQRILIIEEDLPITAEAFRVLHAIWTRIHVLAPSTPPAPSWELDIVGVDPSPQLVQTNIRYLDAPNGSYDITLSHGFLLDAGHSGNIEKTFFPNRHANFVCLRHAIGFRTERSLEWCEPLHYNLADVERAITSQNDAESEPMPQEKHEALLFFLQHVFRKRDFWDGQLRVIARLLQGKASIVLLPTGGGKSLTYQLSGLLLPGMTIIIDPLISLMTDQTENLQAAGIDLVGSVSSQDDSESKNAVIRNMGAGRLAFTFISPERLQSQEFRDQLKVVVARFPVSLAVIDEAHCVSEWGHDFRLSYLHMPHNLQQHCSDSDNRKPTLVGLTGTASFAVLTDIQMEMKITDEDATILPQSFDRQELCFEVRNISMEEKPSALKTIKMQLPRILRSNPQHFYDLRGDHTNSGIIFCPHVNGPLGVASVASNLGHRNFFAGGKPKVFGGDGSQWNSHKRQIQKAFKKNQVQELVATKSFGMGIDKPNIRYTIHYTVPQSVEAFYQEAGRAGRNGIPQYALCSILYSDNNWDSAVEVLNEPDHRVALARLDTISWNDRGDLLTQLWLLFNSYSGRSEEKKLTFNLWKDNLAPIIAGMRDNATHTKEILFHNDKEHKERAIFRLMLLGVVQDYTINWQQHRFAVRIKRIHPAIVRHCLSEYLMQYKRKLPRQGDNSKVEYLACSTCRLNMAGGMLPKLSWGRSSL